MTAGDDQRAYARERMIANNYTDLILDGIDPERAAAVVAHSLSTPSSTVQPSSILPIVERVKQRDNA